MAFYIATCVILNYKKKALKINDKKASKFFFKKSTKFYYSKTFISLFILYKIYLNDKLLSFYYYLKKSLTNQLQTTFFFLKLIIILWLCDLYTFVLMIYGNFYLEYIILSLTLLSYILVNYVLKRCRKDIYKIRHHKKPN